MSNPTVGRFLCTKIEINFEHQNKEKIIIKFTAFLLTKGTQIASVVDYSSINLLNLETQIQFDLKDAVSGQFIYYQDNNNDNNNNNNNNYEFFI